MRILSLTTAVFALGASLLAGAQTVFDSQDYKIRAVKVVQGLHHPWGLAFLPDGRMLVTERRGTLRIIENGKLLPAAIEGIPVATQHGQGGLLDVAIHPKYAENGWIYWSYNGMEGGLHGTELARGKLGGTKDAPRMTDVQVLF
ncbi:MAG: PQQ-dependent sugar dehydrogenase, partial [Betaproteobacteria bacterium]|nr:PQQ-dependent sugar dehydrogenase [Betaproteobacteria bacterium]